MALEIGTLLNDRYRIEQVLGQGGFGAVYLALDRDLGIPCAVKENLSTSPQAERQFRREATLLAGLRHPNLPRVTNHFVLGGHQYLVMDYIEGDDLRQRLDADGALPPSDAVRWVVQLCDALVYLHGQKPAVIHRDIKPANIKITPEGTAVLVDFGIAKVAESGQKTTTGAAALTSGYAPPEQYQLGATDGRTDEYALAATLYHLVTGRVPPDSVERLIGQAQLVAPETLRPDLAENVTGALRRGLEIRPDARFESVGDFRAALLDAEFRYTGAPEPAAPAPAELAPAVGTETAAAAAPPTRARPRTWGQTVAALMLALFLLVMLGYLAVGLTWVFVGPFTLNNLALKQLGLPTAWPLRAAQVSPVTPYPTSSPYVSPTLSATPTLTPLPSATPTATPPFTPTPTPAPQIVDAGDVRGWRLFNTWPAADNTVLAALSPDGQTAAVYRPDIQGVDIVAAASGESQTQLRGFLVPTAADQRHPIDLGLTEGQVLVLLEREILVWDLAGGAVVDRLTFFPPPARQMRLSPDRRWVAVRAKYLTVYNLESKRLYNLGDQGANQAYAFSPDGRYVALAVDTDVELYRLSDGRLERRLSGRNKTIRGLAFTADSARVVATSGDVWDTATGDRLATFDSAAGLQQVVVSPTGVVIVGSDGVVWSLAAGARSLPRVGRVPGLPAETSDEVLTFLQGGALLFVQAVRQDPALYALDPNVTPEAVSAAATAPAGPAREPIGLLNVSRLGGSETLQANAQGVALSPGGTLAAAWSGASVTINDVVRGQRATDFPVGGGILEAAFLDEANLLVLIAAGRDRAVERWDISTRELRQRYGPYDDKNLHLAASGAANLFAVQGKYIQIVDVESGALKFNLGSADSYQPFAFTPDGKALAIAAKSAVSLWDMGTGRQIPGQFGGHGPDVTGLAFTPDGRYLAAASGDVWEVASRRRQAAFDPVPGVALSPDGALAVGYDGTLWDAGTGQYLGRWSDAASWLAFTPDGGTLVWYRSAFSGNAGPVLLFRLQPVAAHQKPAASGAAAPERLPLTAASVVSATVLGWWGPDPILDARLVQDPPQASAVNFGQTGFEALTLSPDGRTFTALTAAGLQQVDPATGALVDAYAIFLNPETVEQATYLGTDLLLLKPRAGVERWNLAEQTLVQRYNVLGQDMVASPDGRWFALRQANEVAVVEAASGAVKYRYRVQAGAQEYQFTPDGRQLAVTTGLFVEFYDLETGKRAAQLRGRSGRPFGLAFAPDGGRLYAASGDAWSLPDGQPLFEKRLDLTAARLAVSPDGALLAADDGSVWDAASGRRVATLPELRAPAVQVLFTADGRQILWRTADQRVFTWAVRPAQPSAPPAFGARAITVDNSTLFAVAGHLGRGRLLGALWSVRDEYLAVNTTENAILYDGATLQRRAAFLDAAVLAFNPDGQALIGGLDHSLQLVDPATGQVLKDYQRTGILAAAFSPDGSQLAVGGRLTEGGKALDGLAVIDPDGLERTLTAGAGAYTRFTGLEFTSDGAYLVASYPGVNTRGSIWIWDVANGSRVREPIQGNSLPAAISPDGRYLAYLSGTRLVRENLETGGGKLYINADGTPFIQQSIDYPTKFPLAYQFVRTGELLVFYTDTSRRGRGLDSSAVLWRYSATSVEGPSARFPASLINSQMNGLLHLDQLGGYYQADYARERERLTPTFRLGPAEKYFVSLTGDGLVRVWDYTTGKEVGRSETDSLPLFALSPDGQTVAVPSANGTIELRSVATGALERALAGEWYPDALAYASDSLLWVLQSGRLSVVNVLTGVVVEASSGDLYTLPQAFAVNRPAGLYALWSRPGGRTVLNVFSLAPDRVLFSLGAFPRPDQLAFSPDGCRLAVARGKSVEVWDLMTRQIVWVLPAQRQAVGQLAFNPAGTRLYAASGEIWDLATGQRVATFDSQASAILITPDGQLIVGNDGTLWNAADGLLTGALAGVRVPAVNFAFTPDGERLLWQRAGGPVEIWALGP